MINLNRLLQGSISVCLILTAGVASGAVINVPAGGDLQAALNSANPGDVILLAPGVTYTGNFTLPEKSGTAEILVTTNQTIPSLRVTPSSAAQFAKLAPPNGGSVVSVAPYAAHWRLLGLEIAAKAGVYNYGLVNFSSPTPTDENSYPAHIRVDRCYIHGDPSAGTKRGIALNGIDISVENSYVKDVKSNWQDSQAIAGWTGRGPFLITNNYLEGGQAILFGGAAPSIPNLIPSNITITNNYMSRPMSWKGVWPVKNQLEFKIGENVTVTGNVIENNWTSAQSGYIILFTVRTCEAGNYSWSRIQNVNFSYNLIRNSDYGVNILGTDNARSGCGGGVAGLTSDVTIANNLFESINYGFFQLLSGAKDITVDHNTVMENGDIMGLDGTPSYGFVFENNITGFAPSGVLGNGTNGVLTTFAKFAPDGIYQHNAMITPSQYAYLEGRYPKLNYFPSSIDAVDFVDYGSLDYALQATSPYAGAGTDGKDLGADYNGVTTNTATAVSGNALLGN